MRKGLYAVRDTLAGEVYGGLHVFAHDAVAVRFFSDLIDDTQGIGRYPQDHELLRLGMLETETGIIEGHEVPVVVVTGSVVMTMKENKANG